MSLSARRWRRRREAVLSAMWAWDPLQVADLPGSEGEYDELTVQVLRITRSASSLEEAVGALVTWFETHHGFVPARDDVVLWTSRVLGTGNDGAITLSADLEDFPDQAEAEALLRLALDVLADDVGGLAADPLSSRDVPGDVVSVQRELQGRVPPARRVFSVTEAGLDVSDGHQRDLFCRYAYWSDLATVWSHEWTEIFEACDSGLGAAYYLTPAQLDRLAAACVERSLAFPASWRARLLARAGPRWGT